MEQHKRSLSSLEILSNAGLLTISPAAGDRPRKDVIRQMGQDNRAISFISGQIRQLEDTMALLRTPSNKSRLPQLRMADIPKIASVD